MKTNAGDSVGEETVHVSLNLAALLLFADEALKETVQFVAFGLAAGELADPDDIRLPGTLIAIGQDQQLSIPTLRSEYGNWLVGLCLRRYVEVHNTFFEKVGVIARMVEFQREPFYYDSKEIGQAFNNMGLPDKLDRIGQALDVAVNSELRLQVESINRARNCFEHRRGIVQARDLHGMNSLVVSWSGTDAVRISVSGTETPVLELPAVIGPGERFEVRWKERAKSFHLGEQLRFSAGDVSEMGLTFFRHSLDLVSAIQQAIES